VTQLTNDETAVRDGVSNLILNCVGVELGESILLLNENGGVDRDLISLMEEAIKSGGGTPYSLWVDPLAGIKEMPKLLGSAVLAADKLVMNVNLNRAILLEHLRANGQADMVRINNRSRLPDAFTSEHARFNWKLVMALASKIEEVTSAASDWTITSPYGTNISGKVASESEVADAFFVQDAAQSRMERVFPGEVFAPVGSTGANGTIAFDHPGFSDKARFINPMMLTVTDGMVTDIDWMEEPARTGQKDDPSGSTVWTLDQLIGVLTSNEEKFGRDRTYAVDSWHGGMHPKAVKKGGQQSNQDTMHFHIGRVPSARSAYVSDQTITLDGKAFWDKGRAVVLDDLDIRELASEYGVQI
jgi:hypothetical protein